MRLNLPILLLLAAQLTAVVVAGIGRSVACCTKITDTTIPVALVVKYTHQDASLCPIRAVRFTTKKDRVICSDPERDWAKFVMCMVDKKPVNICKSLLSSGQTKSSTTTPPKPSTTVPSEPPRPVPSEPPRPVHSEPPRPVSSEPPTPVPSEPPTTVSSKPLMTVPSEPPRTSPSEPPRTSPSAPPTMSMPLTVTTKEGTMATTPNAPDENLGTMAPEHATTRQLPTTVTTKLLRWTTRARASPSTSVVTSVIPQRESEASTFAVTSRLATRSANTDPEQEPPSSMGPPTPTPQVSKSTTMTDKPDQAHKIPWTLKRLKKKRKSGLRKAQKKKG